MSRTIVVGAGAIGLACAYSLRKRGRDVLVVDKGSIGGGSTKGNAGWITPSLSGPIPAPGLTWTSLKWMLRSDSPLYIAPGAALGMIPWLWRFWRCCNSADFTKGLRAVAELNRGTLAGFDQLAREGVRFELHRDGMLFLFLDPGYMEKTRAEFEEYRNFGYPMPTPLGNAELRALEPELSTAVQSGFMVEAEYHVRPETLAAGYAAKLAEMGVEIRTGVTVEGAVREGDRITALGTSGGPIPADHILVAAGAWSGQLVQKLGASALPVQAGKGYSLTLTEGGPTFSRPLYLGEARVGCSPFDGATRFAGTMELSGVNEVFDRRRVVGIRKGISRYFEKGIEEGQGTEWVGMRPLTPDGLPMLGLVPGLGNVSIATGHAMLGITMAPVTGEAMAELLTEGDPKGRLAPFAPGRFR